MHIVKADFSDFEAYNDMAANWELDFRLLSKNNFYAYLDMYSGAYFQLTRTKLNGKIEQIGMTPDGFRSIVIPVNFANTFYWLNKKVSGRQLLIFPKNRTLDAVSFEGFDVYIVAIKESFLLEILDDLGYDTAKKLFSGDEQYLDLTPGFAHQFSYLASRFLSEMRIDYTKGGVVNVIHECESIDGILLTLLKYLDSSSQIIYKNPSKKRDTALNQAVELIHGLEDLCCTVGQLCAYTNVSERTLEYAFQERYQISPSEYIKANRLHKVRHELLTSKGETLPISTLAGKYGFWHMGQFASDFKKHFGKLPRETVREHKL